MTLPRKSSSFGCVFLQEALSRNNRYPLAPNSEAFFDFLIYCGILPLCGSRYAKYLAFKLHPMFRHPMLISRTYNQGKEKNNFGNLCTSSVNTPMTVWTQSTRLSQHVGAKGKMVWNLDSERQELAFEYSEAFSMNWLILRFFPGPAWCHSPLKGRGWTGTGNIFQTVKTAVLPSWG